MTKSKPIVTCVEALHIPRSGDFFMNGSIVLFLPQWELSIN